MLFERLQAANPEPVSELQYSTPFELLVAVMLSAHTTDRSVNAATAKLFPVANTPQALLALGVEGVKPYLKTVGLYNAKASQPHRTVPAAWWICTTDRCLPTATRSKRCRASVARPPTSYSTWPSARPRSPSTPISSGSRTAPGWRPVARRARSRSALLGTTPREFREEAHHWLLLHGRYVCTPAPPSARSA